MKSLSFMIIGVQKSGTTALAEFLNEHPDVLIVEGKEAHLFDSESFQSKSARAQINETYVSYFPDSKDSQVTGEATPIYVFIPAIAKYLAAYNPELKVIVILRDPVERAYSHYRMERERGHENLPFWLALSLESVRLMLDKTPLGEFSSLRRHSYRSRGLYARQLENLLEHFPREQVLVIKNEDLRNRHAQTLSRVFAFLGVREASVEQREVHSRSGDLSEVPLSAYWLRCSFRREMWKLRELVDFSVDDWF